ncbi:phage portal protein [Sphingomonas sp. PP-CE-1G-424]|uniref:phage portal protein n=1 Tax=Sphingomonas sp. PP-CE-1G-424 TaxID=2135658 RepID=UPI0010544CAE|nr:phage portal protein [Sphingomonas sp. PP-CE-1G-424]TCP63852.1 HK97 family phage portal protein [Sphingomonas sp. PP-CE-1G-424]
MGILDRARAATRALRGDRANDVAVSADEPAGMPMGPAAPAIVASADGMSDTSGYTFMNLLGGSRGGPIGEQAALSSPAVLRALEVLTGLFAMAPLVYYRSEDGGKVRVDDAPPAIMLRTRTNDVQNAFLFKELMLGDLIMTGRFAGYIHRDPLYRASKLTRVDPHGILPVSSWDKADGLEVFYDTHLPNGTFERLTRNDLWYIPGFSRDGLVGIDRLKLLQDTLQAAAATSAFAARFWENNAQPSTILTSKSKMEQVDKTKLKNDWQSRFSGPKNAGAVAVLDQEMDAKFLAHDNAKSQYVEVRGFYVVEIARAFGVPPHVVFELSRATFSNIEQQSLELILYSMMGHFERVAAAATHQFAEPGHFFEFLPDALLKGDIKSRYEAYSIAIDKGILNPDEVRSLENRNKRPGGEKYRVGSGSQIEGEQQPAPAALPAPEKDEDPE